MYSSPDRRRRTRALPLVIKKLCTPTLRNVADDVVGVWYGVCLRKIELSSWSRLATLLQLSVTFAQTKQEVVRALAAGRRNVVGYGRLDFIFFV